MEDAFGYVLFGVVAVGVVLAIASLFIKTKTYEEIGANGFFKPEGEVKEAAGIRDEEIRQLLGARNYRHELSGGDVVDVDDELARLTAPAADPELRDEIRSLVIARNERRARKGQAPLDVDAEIERQLRELG